MSPSEADAARKKAEEAVAKATEMAKAAKMAKAEAGAAKKAAEGARMNEARVAEEKAAMALAEKGMARRLAAKEAAAKTKVSEAKAAWERARDEMRNFKPIEAAIRPVVYRAVSAAASAKEKDGNTAGFPDREDSLDNVERAIKLISYEEIDPMAERVSERSEWGEVTKPNPWKDLTRNERVAWKVVKEEMKEYMKAGDVLDSALFAAYKTALEAAEAEMERLCEVAKVGMHWYEDAFEYVENREIKLMIWRCLTSTAMPDAGEIVRQIRSSIRVLQGLDVFFETDSIMTLLRYEHDPKTSADSKTYADLMAREKHLVVYQDKIKDVSLCLGGRDIDIFRVPAGTIRRFYNTLRRLKEMADGLEMVRGGRGNGKETGVSKTFP